MPHRICEAIAEKNLWIIRILSDSGIEHRQQISQLGLDLLPFGD